MWKAMNSSCSAEQICPACRSASRERGTQWRKTPGNTLLIAVTSSLLLTCAAYGADSGMAKAVQAESSTRVEKANTMKIRLTINGKAIPATLRDNATSRDFLSLLPLTLTLEDYNATEKISYLPRKLSTTGAPAGIDPEIGDIAYYAPWGNLAIFYKDFRHSPGLIRLGRIDGGVEALNASGSISITIESGEK
jgi:hypothetical protein